jgi:hypothetical protein
LLDSPFEIFLSITTLDWICGDGAAGAGSLGAGHVWESSYVLGLVAAFENTRNYSLVLGIGGIAGGVLLFINHKRHLDQMLASDAAERVKAYESRKYRRRAIASAMIASVGCMLAALYWVNDARVFSVFILMILSLLVGILGVALIDLFSVGLQQIATPDDQSRKAMIEELLRQREESETDEEKS